MKQDMIQQYREFLKDSIRLKINFSATDQNKGISPPPLQKPYSEKQRRIALPKKGEWPSLRKVDLATAIEERESHRQFTDETLKLDELAFLLWATQGIRMVMDQGNALRVVPSAGCRHAFETYLAVLRVESLAAGIYRYLPIEHALVFEHSVEGLSGKLVSAALNQDFIGEAPVTFIWSVIPYRMEWRYGLAAHRVIAIDIGHVCQNLYLASQAVGCGTCAVAAYHQERIDHLLKLDGTDEFTTYLAPVGKIR